MDTSKWRPTQGASGAGGDSSMDSGDWRAQLQADSRQRIVNKIMDTLKSHLPFCGHEGLQELKKVAVRLEEKIYAAATSQSDYLRKISLKMLPMETGSKNPMPDAMQSNSAANSVNPSDPGMPISTVASESTFSTGGRVIDQFRSSLTSETAEALICTQDCIRSPPTEIEFQDISLVALKELQENLEKLEVDEFLT